METSLAPSPIARVTAFLWRLTRSTTRAFCRGVTRQQMTALHLDATSRNNNSMDGCRACTSECPLTTRAKPPLGTGVPPQLEGCVLPILPCWLLLGWASMPLVLTRRCWLEWIEVGSAGGREPSGLESCSLKVTTERFGAAWLGIVALFIASRHRFNSCSTSSYSQPSMVNMSIISSVKSWHEYPILMAVSCLSPVRTHNLMFAAAKFAIHWGTPSWSLSSMAVVPTRISCCSISS